MAKEVHNRKQRRLDRRSDRQQGKQSNVVTLYEEHMPRAEQTPLLTEFEPKKPAQGRYAELIQRCTVVFGTGSAGTGKTHVATALGALAILEKRIKKIVIVRPILEAKGGGQGIGFLPGDEAAKVAPYLAPVREILSKYITPGYLDYLFSHGHIVFMPMEYMRGHTFNDCWIIVDEAQNATKEQMKLALTRLGHGSKLIVNGDTGQVDLTGKHMSGLFDAVKRFGTLKGVGHYNFVPEDIVRHGLVAQFIRGYEEDCV